jgi:kynurenine formamidase
MAEIDAPPVAALDAVRHEVSRSPFGPEDQIGMLNLITAESRSRIMAEADWATVFDLSVDFFVGMPSWTETGDPPYQIWMSHTPRGQVIDNERAGRPPYDVLAYSGDCVTMYSHCGTHIDTLNHYGYRGEIWNGFTEQEHLGARHWHVCGADQHPPIVARGVLIDVAGAHGVEMLPDSYGIGPDDLRQALDRQGTRVLPGDVVLVRTGRMRTWPDPERFLPIEPGLNRAGAAMLAEAGAIVIGGDNIGLEQFPSVDPENWVPVHTYLLVEAGVAIMEVVDCEEIAAAGLFEFAFMAATIKLRGATAAPLRPLVFPLRS